MRWETLLRDLHYTFRTFRRDIGFVIAAILIIGIGIGANTAIFSVVRGLLFRPLQFQGSERLVWIANNGRSTGLSSRTSRVSTFLEWQKANRSFEDMSAYFAFFDYGSYTMTGSGEPERLIGVGVAQNLLSFLGVKPALGRNFRAEECQDNVPLAVILTNGFWQRRFGADPKVIGRQVTMNARPATVIGVLPADFDFAGTFVPGSRVDMIVPFPLTQTTDRYGNTLAVIGRLKPGVTIAQAQSDVDSINAGIRAKNPGNFAFGAKITELRDYLTGRFRQSLLLLVCAVGSVLLIACTNLSNLLLARGTGRRKEMATRSALGATRGRLIRQMLIESLLLSACGAVVGVLLAIIGVRYIASIDSVSIPLLSSVTIDGPALLFTAIAALATGLLFGIVPALQASSAKEAEMLKDVGRGMSDSKRGAWTQNALVVSEVALACVLLVGAGLLIRSFLRVLDVELGYEPSHVAAWRVATVQGLDSPAKQTAYYERFMEGIRAIPGVQSVGASDALPLSRDRSWGIGAVGVNYPPGQGLIAHPRIIDSQYLRTMAITIKAGRDFTPRDTADAEPVVIINEKAARTLFPDRDAVGQKVRFSGERRVVGVVANVRHLAVEQEGGFEAYIPVAQVGSGSLDLVVRSTVAPEAIAASVRRALNAIAPSLPTSEYHPLNEFVDRAVSPRQFLTLLLGAFAAAALTLAALGIYGVVSYGVTQRLPEIGIRMALGASPGRVRGQVMQHTVKLVSAGLVIGLVSAFVLTRLAESLLFGLQPSDPVTFGVTVAVLLATASIAGYIPALRASRTNPMSILR